MQAELQAIADAHLTDERYEVVNVTKSSHFGQDPHQPIYICKRHPYTIAGTSLAVAEVSLRRRLQQVETRRHLVVEERKIADPLVVRYRQTIETNSGKTYLIVEEDIIPWDRAHQIPNECLAAPFRLPERT